MISSQELRKMAREKSLPLDMLEKDYILGWVLFGVLQTSASHMLSFKGGTALSKVHFPWQWRLSEDLDFTLMEETGWDELRKNLESDISSILKEKGMEVKLKDPIHTNPEYFQAKLGYQGPISKGTIKVEITKEPFIGDIITKQVPVMYSDYPDFDTKVYSLENILAEKMRAIIQRGKVRDYYDVWKLLGESSFDKPRVKSLFSGKCNGKKIDYTGIDQFFPDGIEQTLKPHFHTLTRLQPSDLPELSTLLKEAKSRLSTLLN